MSNLKSKTPLQSGVFSWISSFRNCRADSSAPTNIGGSGGRRRSCNVCATVRPPQRMFLPPPQSRGGRRKQCRSFPTVTRFPGFGTCRQSAEIPRGQLTTRYSLRGAPPSSGESARQSTCGLAAAVGRFAVFHTGRGEPFELVKRMSLKH